jgi:RNA polymerase sigma-70 factor, ECF subfamily
MDNYHLWSDANLVTGVIQRQEDAFAELFRRHSPSVTATSRMILGSRPECEDVAAEVFIGLWRLPETFQPHRGSLLSYLRVQARGRSIDIVRSETARIRREQKDVSKVAPSPESDARLLVSEAEDQLRDALAALPSEQRGPIELAYFKGMTYSEAAEFLRLPEGTVKTRIRKGLRTLRAELLVGPNE